MRTLLSFILIIQILLGSLVSIGYSALAIAGDDGAVPAAAVREHHFADELFDHDLHPRTQMNEWLNADRNHKDSRGPTSVHGTGAAMCSAVFN
jgi:hypothetical protein